MRKAGIVLLGLALLGIQLAPRSAAIPPGNLGVEDIFGRSLTGHGLVLVDWEGHMANPAIKFFLLPPPDAALPARAVLTSSEPALYFNLPSTIGPTGPRKEIEFQTRDKVPVLVSIFPDRGNKDKDYKLNVAFTDARGQGKALSLPIHVIDQDRDRPAAFTITVDFSQDRTGFFKDPQRQAVVVQAANDWSAYLDDMKLDPIPAGREQTFIWNPDGFKTGHYVTNARAYTGYLLYAYGIQSSALRSGGEPSQMGGLQTSRGTTLPFHCSGCLEVEVQGNYNTKGWHASLEDSDWWKDTNLGDVENDLYSIAHHEIGHALFFNPANPVFKKAKAAGQLQDAAVRFYLGTDPKINGADHFDGTIDPVSRRGAFGYEYYGDMPQGRWLITKSDLHCAQAVGYKLRETSALAPLVLAADNLHPGTVGQVYSGLLHASGGIPFYDWEVVAGSLPNGLVLDSFTGVISGTPLKRGNFDFTVRVRQYKEETPGQRQHFRIDIG